MANESDGDSPITRNSAQALVDACLKIWVRDGSPASSARSICREAGIPVSSIYHFFGDMEHLYLEAHNQALACAEAWCEARIADIAATPFTPESIGYLLSGVIDDWCMECRPAAIAWLECRRAATRNDRFAPLVDRWKALWGNFWSRLCANLGMEPHAAITCRFFEAESFFHLARWHRSLDRHALDEVCAAWGAWLNGGVAGQAGFHDLAREQAIRELPAFIVRDVVLDELANAAARVVMKLGVNGLTYRAVAAEAGRTLGFVSHKLHTKADLLNAAFHTLRQRHRPSEAELSGLGDQEVPRLVHSLAEGLTDNFSNQIELNELLAVCVSDNSLRPFAAQLRYLIGSTGRHFLSALLGRTVSTVEAAAFSTFLTGVQAAYVFNGERQERLAKIENDLQHLTATLRIAPD